MGMTESDQYNFKRFAAAARQFVPNAEIFAFGSRARGDYKHDMADLDVCVISEDMDEALERSIVHAAWEVGFDMGRLIVPVCVSAREFYHGVTSITPLHDDVLREGVRA
jgi:uncharacterized protein